MTVHFIDCAEADLGRLKPPAPEDRLLGCEEMAHGLIIPDTVLEELHRLGFPLSSYTQGQLIDAIQACKLDANLVDDPLGDNFSDMLTLTNEEAAAQASPDFRGRIQQERGATSEEDDFSMWRN